MNLITHEQWKTADNYQLWINMSDSFYIEEIQEFLNRKGYELMLHTGVHENLEHRRSDPGTGSTEHVGNFNTERTYMIAIKPGDTPPARFTEETLKQFGVYSVFQKELRKNLLA